MDLTSVRVWRPSEGITRHSGATMPEDLIFFGKPPLEIGRLITADSTLKTSTKPRSVFVRALMALGLGLMVGLFLWVLLSLFINTGFIGLAIFSIIAIFLFYLGLEFNATCSFVGELGISEITLSEIKKAKPSVEVKTILFRDISHLYTSQTRRYKNFIYQGTDYRFRWARSKETLHTISGTYQNEKGLPEDGDLWYFGNSGEAAWTNHLLGFVNRDLEKLGYVEFPMSGNPKVVRVGQGFLEFVTSSDETQRVTVNDMQDVRLESGRFYFKHKDSSWWSGKGKYSFSYGEMPNVKLFWLCLNQLTGISL